VHVVLDTNILLSALRSGGAPAQIVNVLLRRLRRPGASPDPGDEYLLAMALASGADLLVTGDKPLLALRRIGRTRIVPARRFAGILAR
jgi:predicted nucleic acid-binding protein